MLAEHHAQLVKRWVADRKAGPRHTPVACAGGTSRAQPSFLPANPIPPAAAAPHPRRLWLRVARTGRRVLLHRRHLRHVCTWPHLSHTRCMQLATSAWALMPATKSSGTENVSPGRTSCTTRSNCATRYRARWGLDGSERMASQKAPGVASRARVYWARASPAARGTCTCAGRGPTSARLPGGPTGSGRSRRGRPWSAAP